MLSYKGSGIILASHFIYMENFFSHFLCQLSLRNLEVSEEPERRNIERGKGFASYFPLHSLLPSIHEIKVSC